MDARREREKGAERRTRHDLAGDCILQRMNFTLKMMDFTLKMMDFILKMMGCILNMMNFILKLMDLAGGDQEEAQGGASVAICIKIDEFCI